ncbi:Ig-like domain-containing protein, partial [Mesobacillus subterraneus]|uniref:Ig-like domain-containing protein n=1 Tax=Mesobacillus subterraneus TaxID=285983 RepID=UPI001CFF1A03
MFKKLLSLLTTILLALNLLNLSNFYRIEVYASEVPVFNQITGGNGQTLAVKEDGTLWTWGGGYFGTEFTGEVSTNNKGINSTIPVRVPDIGNVKEVSAGTGHVLTLKNNGTVWAWGRNDAGQVGNGTTNTQFTPVLIMDNVKKVKAGDSKSYAIKNDGTLWVWGSGAKGDGYARTMVKPEQVVGIEGVTDISSGYYSTTMVLKSDGTVWTVINNRSGELGNGFIGGWAYTYVKVSGLTDIVQISSGEEFHLAVKSDGTVWSWGLNAQGQLGDGTITNKNMPVQVKGLKGIKKVVAGRTHSLALKEDGTVWAWGNNYGGVLGDGTTEQRNSPVQVQNLAEITDIGASYSTSFAIKNDGTIVAWGSNYNGYIGDGTKEDRLLPTNVVFDTIAPALNAALPMAGEVNVDVYKSITLTFNEHIQPFLYGDIQLVDSNNSPVQTEYKVSQNNLVITPINNLSYSTQYSLAIPASAIRDLGDNPISQNISLSFTTKEKPYAKDLIMPQNGGSFFLMSDDSTGILEDGLQPELINGMENIIGVGEGNLFLKSDGYLYKWKDNRITKLTGLNNIIQIDDYVVLKGDGTVWEVLDSPYATPTFAQVNGFINIKSISVNSNYTEPHIIGLKTDGTVWSIGNNFYGELGDGTKVSPTVPVEMESISGAVSMAAGKSHSLVLKDDGTVWAVGTNEEGQLGVSKEQLAEALTPVQIPSLSNITQIDTHESFSAALAEDGTLWVWGNTDYNLSPNFLKNQTPATYPELTNVSDFSLNYSKMHLLKDDQSVWNVKQGSTSIVMEQVMLPPRFIEKEPPFIQSTNPEKWTNHVGLDRTIKINFNEEVVKGPMVNQITVKDKNGAFVSIGSISTQGRTLEISPLNGWDYFQTYKVSIPVGAVKDLAGNQLQTGYEFEFNTLSEYVDLKYNVEFLKLKKGKQFQTNLTLLNWDGTTEDITDSKTPDITDPTVATVAENGLLTALAPGQTSVTVYDQVQNKGASFELIVTEVKVPEVEKISDKDTFVTGLVDPGANVYILKGENIISSGTASETGDFSIPITIQEAGTILKLYAVDQEGDKSETASITVVDETAPDKPLVNPISNIDTSISGVAEIGSEIKVSAGDEVFVSTIVGEEGIFNIPVLPPLTEGTVVKISATDSAGNVSETVLIIVEDKIPPSAPAVNPVSESDTVIRGTTEAEAIVTIKNDREEIAKGMASGEGTFELSIPKQRAGTELLVTATDETGNESEITTVTVMDITPPTLPLVNEVTDQSVSVTGQAEPLSKITIKIGTQLVASGTTAPDGNFSVGINEPRAGTILSITATDSAGNTSEVKEVIVKDVTAPAAPQVDVVTELAVEVFGRAEAGSRIEIKVGSQLLASGTASSDGYFSIEIPKQVAGTMLKVIATDTAGNVSSATEITVKDIIAPAVPVVNQVTDQSNTVTGQAEAGSKINIKIGTELLGTGNTAQDGRFSIAIAKQKAGTIIEVTATDSAGNISGVIKAEVVDVTPPNAPVVNQVTDQSTAVTGKAEHGAIVRLVAGTRSIGTGVADSEGNFSIGITKQAAGIVLKVTATDASGNTGETTEVTIEDVTPPSSPEVNEVTDQSTYVTGRAEPMAKIEVTTGSRILGTATVDIDGDFSALIVKQSAGTVLKVTVTDLAGNISSAEEVNVIDVTAPSIAVVNEVTNQATFVSGKAEPLSKIQIKVENEIIGSGTTAPDGTFSVGIAKQNGGTVLKVTATDASGNTSTVKEVIVKDVTAPSTPEVNEVTDQSTAVTGKAEAGSKIDVKVGTQTIGSGTTDSTGNFSVGIAKQKAGTILKVTATDASGNTSTVKEITVKDITPPSTPVVNEVTDQSTAVSGTAEVGSKIDVKVGTQTIGSGATDVTGNFSVGISKQKAGTILKVTAADASGNASTVKEITVKDITPPSTPVVNEVTDQSTAVSGTAEAGSKIDVKVGTQTIGSGTTDSAGNFSVGIAKRSAGTVLKVTATDASGNTSTVKEITVKDVTPPSTPVVNEVTDQSTTVTGKAEAGSKIDVK